MWNYDRVQALIDGRVPIEGCSPEFEVLPPEDCFHRAYVLGEFDVSEIGFGPFLIALALDQTDFAALPVFLSRMFRHSSIYVRSDRGIESPRDLNGRKIGIVEYQMSAVMWCRGFLTDDFGIDPCDIAWRQGGVNTPGRREKFPLNLPPGFPLEPIPEGCTLTGLLAEGDLDAVISPEPPTCFQDGSAPVVRLFEDFEAVERDYYQRTRIFPIMHAVGIRKGVLKKHPWIARNVYTAFKRAKHLAEEELFEFRAPKVGLPWVASQAMQTRSLMGEDFWPYGLEKNRTTLEAMTRYSFEQGLSRRRLDLGELFVEDRGPD